MRRFRVVIVVFMVSVSSCPGCREPPDPPSQEAVDMAWHRADQAVVSAERARNEARQAGRLRDIDRLRAEAERDELAGQVSVLRGVSLALCLLLLVALPWLAVEVRRRRMWAHLAKQVAGPATIEPPVPDPRAGPDFEASRKY